MISRFIFRADFTVEEFPDFHPLYARLHEELLGWHERRGKRCVAVRIHATIHPWIAGRVRQYLRELRNSESHAFLQHLPMEIDLTALDGKPVERYTLEPGTTADAEKESG